MRKGILLTALFLVAGSGFAQMGKLDPQLGLLWRYPERIEQKASTESMIYKTVDEVWVEAIVTHDGGLVDYGAVGATVLWKHDAMAVVRIPVRRLNELAEQRGVRYVEAPHISRLKLDESAAKIGAPQVWRTQGLTGKNVIVGVIDSGIDWKHPAFRHADGTTRILYLLDLSENGSFYGGRMYTEAEINLALQSGTGVRHRDYSGHGTHVAGIIAGNGISIVQTGVYTGIAPDANLVVVKAARNELATEFKSSDQLIALAFVDSVAAVLGQPYVVNLSMGGHYGAHDGTSPVERFIDTLTGSGKPGKAVVTVAGNEGNDDIHAQVSLNNTTRESISFNVSGFIPSAGSGNDQIQIGAWYTGTASVSVTVTTPQGQSYGPVRPEQVFDQKGTEGAVYVWNSFYDQNGGYRPGRNPFNNDREIYIEISDAAGAGMPAIGEWTIEFSGRDAVVDAYLIFSSMRTGFVRGKVDHGKLAIPGTSEQAITVAAYTSKTTWTDVDGNRLTIGNNTANRIDQIAPFSSPGPTRTGAFLKPDIAAPGQMIASAVSADAPSFNPNSIFYTGDAGFPNGFILKASDYGLSSGTSMAAPHVAGACALLFAKYPDLSAPQIRDLLTRGAATDDFVGTVPSNHWGWGKIDINRSILMQPGEDPFAEIDNLTAFPNPFTQATGTRIVYRLPANRTRAFTTVRVYNVLGQKVRTLVSAVRPTGLNQEPWDGRNDAGYAVGPGVYFVEIVSGDHRQIKKLAILG
ncbi:S8 family serine peptidase [candidate division KSB1 bacterium]|nr:S8 family serine peptidase [candidate division KSB1 bacterium]